MLEEARVVDNSELHQLTIVRGGGQVVLKLHLFADVSVNISPSSGPLVSERGRT